MFFEQFEMLCKKINTTPTKFTTDILKLSSSKVTAWKNGSIPKYGILQTISNYFGVSVGFLFDGPTDKVNSMEFDISKKSDTESTVSINDLLSNIEDNAKAMNMKGLQRLSDYSDDLIVNPAYISKPAEPDYLIEFMDAADAARLSSKHNLIIPFFENAVSAGVGEEFITDAEQYIRIPQTYKKLHADYAVRISGNSMEPEYFDGDILLVRFQEQLEPGELGIFIADNRMYFKKLGEDRLISLNPDYDDLMIDAGFNPVVQGKVISKIER